jgi:hypothetical protein
MTALSSAGSKRLIDTTAIPVELRPTAMLPFGLVRGPLPTPRTWGIDAGVAMNLVL